MFRGQVITNAQFDLIKHCRGRLKSGDELVIIIGSADAKPGKENPLPIGTRIEMLSRVLESAYISARIVPLPDYPDNRQWAAELVKAVGGKSENIVVSSLSRWVRNQASYFGRTEIEEHDIYWGGLSASEVRKKICADDPGWKALVPPPVEELLKSKLDGGMTGIDLVKKYCS